MKKLTIDNLTNEMIQIIITEVDTMINKTCIVYQYKTCGLLSRLIAKSIVKYNLEWNSDIIRDACIAALYESMLTVSKDFDIEDINLDNVEYISKSFVLAELLLKQEFLPSSKKNTDGTLINIHENLIEDEKDPIKALELMINEKSLNVGEDKKNQFIEWFDSNKKYILTKKQLQFVDGELVDMDKRRIGEIKKRIADRVSKAYELKYGTVSPRIAALMDQRDTIESILESNNFRAALIPNLDETYIIDAIVDNISLAAAKAFNSGSNEKWVIKEYRIALFKALGNIIETLEKEGV